MIHSQVTEEYPWLYELLDQNEKLEIEDVPHEYQVDFQHVVPYILKQCGEEWKGSETLLNPVEDLGEQRRSCGLCGTPNRYIYYIQNRLNGNTLNVGSDCVEEFSIDFLREGKSKGQLLKEAKRIKRRSVVNQLFPGLENKIDEWSTRLERYELQIPNEYSRQYTADGKRLQVLYLGFLEETYQESVFPEIEQILYREKNYLAVFEDYHERNRHNPFIATSNMIRWLKGRNDNQTIEFLKEDGVVSARTITRVWERTFINRIRPHISESLTQAQLQIEKYDYENAGFVLQTTHQGIRLLIKFEKFFIYFGPVLFGEKSLGALDFRNVLKVSELYDKSSYDAVIEEMSIAIRQSHVGLSTRDDYFSKNEILLIERRSQLILPYNLNEFIHEFKGMAFKLPKPTITQLEEFVQKAPGKRYTRRELDDARRVASEMHKAPGQR